jgi:hypothetical protein
MLSWQARSVVERFLLRIRQIDRKDGTTMAVFMTGRRAGKRKSGQGSRAGPLVVPLALLAALGLGGCGVPAVLPASGIALGVEGMFLNQTGKTASDKIVGWVSGQDCSVLRYTKNGKYCMSAAEIAQEDARVHRPYFGDCYRLRSGVACYDQPDATHTSETTVYNAP